MVVKGSLLAIAASIHCNYFQVSRLLFFLPTGRHHSEGRTHAMGEGFVLVYIDITDRGSFEEVLPLKNILDEIKKPKNVTLILVGNKADLDHSRQVSTEEGEKLATELACAFYECSACTGERGTSRRDILRAVSRGTSPEDGPGQGSDAAPPRTSSKPLIRCSPKSAVRQLRPWEDPAPGGFG